MQLNVMHCNKLQSTVICVIHYSVLQYSVKQ